MKLVVPALDYLDGYKDALRRGWSPDNVRLEVAAREELAKIAEDPAAFVKRLNELMLTLTGAEPSRIWTPGD